MPPYITAYFHYFRNTDEICVKIIVSNNTGRINVKCGEN